MVAWGNGQGIVAQRLNPDGSKVDAAPFLVMASAFGPPDIDAIGDRYQRLRRPAAEQVLGLAGRLTSLATMKHPIARAARNVLLTLLDHAPPAKRALAMNLSGLSRRRFTGSPPGAADGAAPASRSTPIARLSDSSGPHAGPG